MSGELLDNLWETVELVGQTNGLGYDEMVTLGSVFGQMRAEIERLQQKCGE